MDRLLGSPYFWVTLTVVFLGAALAYALHFGGNQSQKNRYKARKKIVIPILVNLGIFSIALGFWFTSAKGLNQELFIFAGIILVLATLSFRFPRACGIPVILILALAGLLLGWNLKTTIPAPSDSALLQIREMNHSSWQKTLEVMPGSRMLWMEGVTNVGPKEWLPSKARIITLAPGLAWLGKRLIDFSSAQDPWKDLGSLVLQKLGWEKTLLIPQPENQEDNFIWDLKINQHDQFLWSQKVPQNTLD